MAQFQIQQLTFAYPERKETLKNVSFSVEQGEYIVLCGQSGSGKTTLLRHLKSVLTPHGTRSGEVLYHGQLLETVPERKQAGNIGYVMQNPDEQLVTDKVWHELAFGLENLGCPQEVMRGRVAEMACYFGIQDWFHREVETLSGGQKQLLNLASIMAMQPEVLLLDEPTSQLDPIAASDFLNTVRKINRELGTTVIITEHRLEDIFPYADRALVMEQGQLVADATPREMGQLLWDRQSPMFGAMPTPVQVYYQTGQSGDSPLTVRDGRNWLTREFPNGVESASLPESAPVLQKELAIEIKDGWFRYEKESPDILRGVHLQVHKGSISAIVGGNGAGKSTLLKAICGICKPYRGKVRLYGKDLKSYKEKERFSQCLAMLPQDPKSLFVKKTVREELEEMTKEEREIQRVTALCKLEGLLEQHPYDLSGGEQQRAAIAKVLLTKPTILLLDEPTKGLDPTYKETFAELLATMREQGVTILMVSHDVEFCARYSDEVSMFFDGQILVTTTPRTFFGGNSFYTTVANRMSRHVFENAVTAEDVVDLWKENKVGK